MIRTTNQQKTSCSAGADGAWNLRRVVADAVKGKELRMAFALGEHHSVDLSDEKRLGFNKFPHGDDPTVI